MLAGHTQVAATRPIGDRLLLVTAGTATSTRIRGTTRSWSLLRICPDLIEVTEQRPDGPGSWDVGRVVRHRRTR